MLKNTKLSEVKRVHIPVAEPKCGEDLSKAMVHAQENDSVQIKNTAEGFKSGNVSQMHSMGVAKGASGMHDSQDGTLNKDGVVTVHTEPTEDSVTDSDMDEVIKGANLNRKVRNVMNRARKEWDNKISATITKQVDMGDIPKSAAGGKRR